MKIFSRVIFLLGWLCLLMTPAAPPAFALQPSKTVLVLSPFQVNLSTNLIAAQAFREEFGNAVEISVDLYFEYLDLNRFPDPAYQQNIFDLLKLKYQNKKIDLVVIGSEAMLTLWLDRRAEILPDTPIVFYDIFTEHLHKFQLPADATGVSGVEECKTSVEWALSALPSVNEIVLVGGVGKIEQGFVDHIQTLQTELSGRVKFTDLSGQTLDEINQQVRQLPSTSIVLYHPMFEDGQGNEYSPMKVLGEIATVSSVPVIGGYDQFIGTGVVGGYMYSIDQQARDAARIGLQILRGAAVSSIPISQNKSNLFIFDHPALQRFDIPLSALPDGGIIKNRQYSFWELYRWQIILAAAGYLIFMALVAFLGTTLSRLSKAQGTLKDLNENLESQVGERTAALSQMNQTLVQEVSERTRMETALRESEQRFGTLLDSLESNIMMIDFNGVHHYVNKVGLATLSKQGDPQEVIGKRLHDLYPAPIADWQLQRIRQVFNKGEGFFGDFYNTHEDRLSWWHLNLAPIRNAAGLVVLVMVNSLDITERKLAEMALQDSELFVTDILNSLTAQIAVLDENGVIININQAWKNFAAANNSLDINHYVGVNYVTVCEDSVRAGDQGAEVVLRGMKAVMNGSQPHFTEEYPCDAPDIPRWFTVTFLPLSGQHKGLIVVHQDITDRKRIEQALKDSEKRTATILRLSPAVIGVSTVAEGRYTDVNDAFEHVLGYSQEEVIGRTSFDLNLWVDEDTRPKILREIQSRGRVDNLEVRLRRKSGEIFHALVYITPITLHNTACLLTMTMDITERKQSEDQLRETRDTLQTIIHSSPLAILTLDAEDHVTMWNPAAEGIFGWSDKQILLQADPTIPESKIKEHEALRNATLSGMSFSNLDTIRMNRDGEQIPVSLSVAPLRGQQDDVIGRLHIITDITERKKLQEELRQQATTDELTKVSNRRHFIEIANSEIKRAIRLKRMPALALVDIDHFKQINDTYGHAAGDQALVAFSQLCQKQIREIDVFARFGGDEFVLLFPETSQEQAFEIVERIRLALTSKPLELGDHQVPITLSCGIASMGDDQTSFDTLLNRADQALYRAKEAGRNRVIIERSM